MLLDVNIFLLVPKEQVSDQHSVHKGRFYSKTCYLQTLTILKIVPVRQVVVQQSVSKGRLYICMHNTTLLDQMYIFTTKCSSEGEFLFHVIFRTLWESTRAHFPAPWVVRQKEIYFFNSCYLTNT